MPQVTALFVSFAFVGSSIGSCIAGGIYTNSLRPALWSHLGDSATTEMVNSLFNSITGTLPVWGSSERDAINAAVSFVAFARTPLVVYIGPKADTGTVLGYNPLHDICCSWCFDTWAIHGNGFA